MGDRSHIDDYLRSRLAERHYPFNPEHWSGAEQLIALQEQRKRRRFLIWLWMGMGILAIATLSTLALNVHFLGTEEAQYLSFESCDQPEEDLSVQPGFSPKNPENEKSEPSSFPHGEQMSNLKDQVSKPDANRTYWKSLSYPKIKKENQRRLAGNSEIIPENIQGIEPGNIEIEASFADSLGEGFEKRSRPVGPRHHLGMEVGLQWNAPFGDALVKDWVNADPLPLLGLRYSYEYSSRLSLRTGLRYHIFSGLASDSTFTSTRFGFGVEERRVLRSPRHLHQLELPIGLSWRLGDRHYLDLGAYASFLLEVTGRETEVLQSGDTRLSQSEERVGGLRQGFSKINAGTYLSYRYYLGKGQYLSGECSLGLKDLTDDDFFLNKRKDLVFSVCIIYSRNLIHR